MTWSPPQRDWQSASDRIRNAALGGHAVGEIIDELAISFAERLLGLGIEHRIAWDAADSIHRAACAVVMVRMNLGRSRYRREVIHLAMLDHLPAVLARWLPKGQRVAFAYHADDPRSDGDTLTVRLSDGQWKSTSGTAGSSPIDLAAHLFAIEEDEAAARLLAMVRSTREAA